MIGRTVGRFKIIRLLGKGGMSKVWEAEDPLLGRTVAVKTLSDDFATMPDARRRFLHEARASALLDHPAIAQVFDAGETDGVIYLALARIDGQTLSERAALSLLPIAEAVRIVCAAAGALSHAHARGIVHRDVTGRNIMIARDGRVFVLDFGLALVAGVSRVTPTGATLGTIAYMAPEIAQGREADPLSDLYSLGVVLFEALTGTFPFEGERLEAKLYAVMNQPPRSPRALRPEISQALEDIVLRAIARQPSERFQSAEAMVAALEALNPGELGSPVSSAVGTPDSAPPRSDPERGPVYLAVLPFQSADEPGQDRESFAEFAGGLAEAVSVALARRPALHVIGPRSGPVPGDNPDWRAIARERGANRLLQGTVRRAGSGLRVTLALVDPERGVHLDGATIEGSIADLFDLEDRVVGRALLLLGAEPQTPRGPHRPPRHDPASRERFLQALGYLQRYDSEAAVDGAITRLEALSQSEPADPAIAAALARACLAKFRLTSQRVWESRAAEACAKAEQLEPANPQVQITRAEVHLSVGRGREALEEFRQALGKAPEDVDGWLGLSRAAEACGELEEAERAARRVTELRPGDWRGYQQLGVALSRRGAYASATEQWESVVRLTPDNARGHRNLGSAYFHLNRAEDAIAAYRRSLEIQPNAVAFSNLGTVLFFLERYEEALDAFERGTALTPEDPLMWGNLGNAAYWIPGLEARARAALERAVLLMRDRLARNPQQAEHRARLAGWLGNLGRQEEALAAIQEALDMAPRDVHCMGTAINVFERAGRRDEALHWARLALQYGYGADRMRRDPELRAMRDDPEFQALLDSQRTGNSPEPLNPSPGGGSS